VSIIIPNNTKLLNNVSWKYSGAITRALDILAAHPEVQDRLRTELTSFMGETGITGDINREKIDALPYLDAVCREVLRLAPPVSVTK
jgi:cytochrome P450